jgi:ribonuclease HII
MNQHLQLPNFLFEQQAYDLGYKCVVGIDEAGRGPLAGPVVAAACYIDKSFDFKGIKDSKQLDPLERKKAYLRLIANPSVAFGVGIVDASVIDTTNILQATMQAMLIAISKMPIQADYLLIDGNCFPKTSLPGLSLVKGDERSFSIAAASIIAKEMRDEIMLEYHKKWPTHGFDFNKGYATREHILAVKTYGVTPIHRVTFEPIRSLVKR